MNFPHLLHNAHLPNTGESISTKNQIIKTDATKMYMLLSGTITEIKSEHKHPHVNRLLWPWDIFPLYLPSDLTSDSSNASPYIYQVTAWWKLVDIPTEDFVALLRTSHELTMQYMHYIGKVLQITDKRVENKISLTAEQSLIHLLLDLANNEQFGQNLSGQMLIKCWLTQQHLASLAWCSRQTVTTVLNDLKSRKLLWYERGRILIYDIENLKKHLRNV